VVAELPAPQRCSDGELIAALTAAGRLEAVFLKTHGTWHLTQGEFGELSCAPAGDTTPPRRPHPANGTPTSTTWTPLPTSTRLSETPPLPGPGRLGLSR